jgi:hypothetical protein
VSIYGPQGPSNALGTPGERPMTTTLKYRPRGTPPGPPQNIQEHIEQAIAKVPRIGPQQRTALIHTLMGMMRDISFIRMLADSARAAGPWSQHAVDHSEGTLPPV